MLQKAGVFKDYVSIYIYIYMCVFVFIVYLFVDLISLLASWILKLAECIALIKHAYLGVNACTYISLYSIYSS